MRMEGRLRMELDAYRTLFVDPTADEEAIRSAYRLLARQYHPDGTEPDPARMTEINLAYDELKTQDRRDRYDGRRRWRAVGPGMPNVSTAGPPPAGPLARRRAANLQQASAVVDFGRYAGWRIDEIALYDPSYLRWLSRHSTGIRFVADIARCLPGEPELGRRTAWVR
jgi:curved DNA-binding protein CbpA